MIPLAILVPRVVATGGFHTPRESLAAKGIAPLDDAERAAARELLALVSQHTTNYLVRNASPENAARLDELLAAYPPSLPGVKPNRERDLAEHCTRLARTLGPRESNWVHDQIRARHGR